MSTLIELEEPFRSVWRKGYLQTHKDGRQYVCLFNSNSDRSLISYARYLVSVREGKFLPDEVEVDHKDDDKTNDHSDNLQILSGRENNRKAAIAKRGKIVSEEIRLCEVCGDQFTHVRDRKTCGKVTCSTAKQRQGNNQRRLTEEEKKSIPALLVSGKTWDEVKKQLNISTATLDRYKNYQ